MFRKTMVAAVIVSLISGVSASANVDQDIVLSESSDQFLPLLAIGGLLGLGGLLSKGEEPAAAVKKVVEKTSSDLEAAAAANSDNNTDMNLAEENANYMDARSMKDKLMDSKIIAGSVGKVETFLKKAAPVMQGFLKKGWSVEKASEETTKLLEKDIVDATVEEAAQAQLHGEMEKK
jgi:hypothetical protein